MQLNFWAPLMMLGFAASVGIVSGGAMATIALVGTAIILGGYFLHMTKENRAGAVKSLWVLRGNMRFFTVFLIGSAALNPLALNPSAAWRTWLEITSIVIPLSLLFYPEIQAFVAKKTDRIFRIIIILFVIGCWIAVARHFMVLQSGVKPTLIEWRLAKLNRGVSYAALMFWPLFYYIMHSEEKKGWWISGLLLGFLPLLAMTHSRATLLGVGVSVGVFAATAVFPRFIGAAAQMGWGGLFLWPWLAPRFYAAFPDRVAKIPDSWRHRVEIWDYIGRYVAEKPLTGWGLSSTPLLPPHSVGEPYLFAVMPSAHPHNAFSQLWVELGVWGAFMGWIGGGLILRALIRNKTSFLSYAFGAMGLGVTLLAVAYDVWSDSLLSTFFITAFMFIIQPQAKEKRLGKG